jgi:hypothetical protein
MEVTQRCRLRDEPGTGRHRIEDVCRNAQWIRLRSARDSHSISLISLLPRMLSDV